MHDDPSPNVNNERSSGMRASVYLRRRIQDFHRLHLRVARSLRSLANYITNNFCHIAKKVGRYERGNLWFFYSHRLFVLMQTSGCFHSKVIQVLFWSSQLGQTITLLKKCHNSNLGYNSTNKCILCITCVELVQDSTGGSSLASFSSLASSIILVS